MVLLTLLLVQLGTAALIPRQRMNQGITGRRIELARQLFSNNVDEVELQNEGRISSLFRNVLSTNLVHGYIN
jgi:hypothetical protein